MKICYILDRYISFHKAGVAYRRCLEAMGARWVHDPREADVVLLHGLIPDIGYHYLQNPVLRHKYVISYAVWETDSVPLGCHEALRLPNEVWTASEFSRAALAKVRDKVFVVPHIVETPGLDPAAVARIKQRIGYREDLFYFYTIGRIIDPRKNIAAAVRALTPIVRAGNARFLIKSHSEQGAPVDRLAMPQGIQIIPETLDEAAMGALHHLCHCYVSSHCSEAWGLGISEAMSCGRLVVATGFGGNMDFMNRENALPVAFSEEPIRGAAAPEAGSYWNSAMRWAYVDEKDLGAKLSYAMTNWAALEPLRQRAKRDVAGYSPEAVTALLRKRLELACNSLDIVALGGKGSDGAKPRLQARAQAT